MYDMTADSVPSCPRGERQLRVLRDNVRILGVVVLLDEALLYR